MKHALPIAVALLILSPVQSQQNFRVYSCFTDRVPAVSGPVAISQTRLYLSIINTEARQPCFVAYQVRRQDFDTGNVLSRNFHTPRQFRDVLLEQSDFTGSGYDIGHAYALASVSANPSAFKVNSFEALFAQTPALNRGPWLKIEERIRELATQQDVAVMAGQLWIDDMPPLVAADEPHAVASHNWIWLRTDTLAEAFLFPQATVQLLDDPSQYTIAPESLMDQVSSNWWFSE